MALYAFDVVRFYDAYRSRSGTHDFYVAGVGTRCGTIGEFLGGAFGLGEQPRLDEACDHLCGTAAGDYSR